MGKIVNRFNQLLDKKREETGQTITLEKVALETNLAYGTVTKWAKGQVTRYDDATLATLCEYFDCTVGDMLVLVRE